MIGLTPGEWGSLDISLLTKKSSHVRVCEKEKLSQVCGKIFVKILIFQIKNKNYQKVN